jgi:PDZ domain-containing protein
LILTTELDLPVEISIDAGVIGGPSAGLMFALSIVDLLEPDDLTGGAVIAGTGILDQDGVVSTVGGVRQKVVGATTEGAHGAPATVFLVPRGNLGEARSAAVDGEILLVPVDSLADALEVLSELRAGREPREALALAPDG